MDDMDGMGMGWDAPLSHPDHHHEDYYIFSGGSPTKSAFATIASWVLGGGVDPFFGGVSSR